MNFDDDPGRTASDESARMSFLELTVATVFTVTAAAIRMRAPINLAIRSLSLRKAGAYTGEP